MSLFRITKRKGLIISLVVWLAASLMLVNLYLDSPMLGDCNCEGGEHYSTGEYIFFSFVNPISIAYWIFIWLIYLSRRFWIWLFSKEEC